jgi:hypothetical protein
VTEQGYPPRHPDHSGRGGRPRIPRDARHNGWQELDAFAPSAQESELPPWAIPGGVEPIRPVRRATRTVEAEPEVGRRRPADYPPADRPPRPGRPARPAGDDRPRFGDRPGFPGDDPGFPEDGPGFPEYGTDLPDLPGRPDRPDRPDRPAIRRPRRSRAAETRRRRGRRRLVTWGSAAIIVVVLVGVGFYLAQPTPKRSPFVTTLQKGEFKAVPDACKAISASVLSQILAGQPGKPVQITASAGDSECTYQVDAKPIFRELDIKVQEFGPNLIAPGNGSATSYAAFSFAQARQALARPSKHTSAPPATISSIRGLGTRAFTAAQVFHQGKVITDRDTVTLQYRNALITINLWANDSKGFGPVSTGLLEPGAVSVARDLLTVVKSEPTQG